MKVLEVPDIKYQPSSIEEKNPISETRLVCSKLNTPPEQPTLLLQTRLPVLAWCQVYILLYTPSTTSLVQISEL
jgi:hypothetical protein